MKILSKLAPMSPIALLLAGCLSKGDSTIVAGGPIGNTPCARYCNAILSGRCDAPGCEESCEADRAAHPACDSFFEALSQCVSKQTIQCDAAGEPILTACRADADDLAACEAA